MKLLLVCSSGGHLTQLWWMKPCWRLHDRCWVTFDSFDARRRLQRERVWFAYSPTNNNAFNLVRNTVLALVVLVWERPDWVVSTGAGVAVPFFWFARLVGAKTVFVEVFDRLDTKSRTGRLVSRFSDHIVVQRRHQVALYDGAKCWGPVR